MYRLPIHTPHTTQKKTRDGVAGHRDLDSALSFCRACGAACGPSSRKIAAPTTVQYGLGSPTLSNNPRKARPLLPVRFDVGERELLQRFAAQADQLRFLGGLLDRPAVLQHALDHPHRADPARRAAVHVDRLV